MDRRHSCPTTCRTARGVHEYAYNIHTSPAESRSALTSAMPTHPRMKRKIAISGRLTELLNDLIRETCWKHLSRNANHGSSFNHHYRLSIPCP